MTAVAPAADHLWPRKTKRGGMYVRSGRTGRFVDSRLSRQAWTEKVAPSIPAFVLIEARKSLASLHLPAATVKSVETFLTEVCTADSTVPAITHGEDEGTALLHWVAGPMSLEVEIGPQGATYLWGVDQNGVQHSVEGAPPKAEALARRLIGTIATRVQQANPDWRRQYLQR